MGVVVPIALWILWAKIYQYIKANTSAKERIFGGGPLVPDYAQVLRWVRISVEWAYGQNPNDETLNVTGQYMFSLIDAAAAQIVVSGSTCTPVFITANPNSQTITSGGNVAFSVLAGGTTPYTYQWQKNGSNITGATLSAAISFVIGWSATPLFVDNTTPLVIPNSQTINFTPGANLIYSGSLAAFANMYVGWAWPATEPLPTTWSNGDPATAINKGTIPDFTMEDVYTVGATKYLACRNPMVLDTSLDLRIIHP